MTRNVYADLAEDAPIDVIYAAYESLAKRLGVPLVLAEGGARVIEFETEDGDTRRILRIFLEVEEP